MRVKGLPGNQVNGLRGSRLVSSGARDPVHGVTGYGPVLSGASDPLGAVGIGLQGLWKSECSNRKYAMMKKFVLIAAGGSGKRMGSSLPKQFIIIAGKPILIHAFQAFLSYAPDIQFVLVLPEPYHNDWVDLCHKHHFEIQHQLVASGPTRFHSVKNGLRHIPNDSLVAIHDGVRPLVSLHTISHAFHCAEIFGSAIPVVKPKESVRMVEGPISKSLDREKLRLLQTPQCFLSEAIKKAYNKNYHESFTDDSSVLEADGVRLFLIDGNHENIKITDPTDLIIAEALLKKTG